MSASAIPSCKVHLELRIRSRSFLSYVKQILYHLSFPFVSVDAFWFICGSEIEAKGSWLLSEIAGSKLSTG